MVYEVRLSDAAARVRPSVTLSLGARVSALKAKGERVFALNAGEPDFDTPQWVKEAGKKAIDAGKTKYTPVGGIPELKAAIAEKFKRDNGLEYSSKEIIASAGAKQCLYHAVGALIGPGDELIVPAPYWVSYADMAAIAGGRTVPFATLEERGFALDAGALEKAVTKRTRVLLLNSPNNPTGAVYEKEALEEVADIALRHNLFVISDEVYECLNFTGKPHVSIAAFPGMKERTLVVNAVSKSHSMTGWRLGYAAGPERLIAAMTNLQGACTSNPSSVSQWAALAALNGPAGELEEMRKVFDARRLLMMRELRGVPGTTFAEPKGAFYVFLNISGLLGATWRGRPLGDAARLAEYLLEEWRVAVVPGNDFGSPRHVRLSYATSEKNIVDGVAQLRAAAESLVGKGGA
ncbi:MAG: pyridoxal phosphate-dependent aminotransferase [Candidatus Micrarchaeia archaeon]